MLQKLLRQTHRGLGLVIARSGLVLWLLPTQGFRHRRAIAGRLPVD